MDELFQHIEARIKALVQKRDYLAKTNNQLKESKLYLAREKEQLLLKQKNMANSIENMIAHLKSIEELS
jgi:uncharacterized protein (TIGR02449 family)